MKLYLLFLLVFCSGLAMAQRTQIRGFADINGIYSSKNDNVSFNLGEQDLFITSDLSDDFTFLGETVFRYNAASPTKFAVSVERIIVKYNYFGNHSILAGKHHTPLNYWNDTYHHGRVFFPTVSRPYLFSSDILPLHTTGVSFQGNNLGSAKLGYDVMVGNGIGAQDILDNDKSKSFTVALHTKPVDGLRIGASYYYDEFAPGSKGHMGTTNISGRPIFQSLISGSVAYFKSNYEFLSEFTMAKNKMQGMSMMNTLGYYAYAGYRIDQVVLYGRLDEVLIPTGEIYFKKDNQFGVGGGIRYEINYLSVVKLEYNYLETDLAKPANTVTVQFAVGF